MRPVRRNAQREHRTDVARWQRAPECAVARPSSALIRRILDRAASSIEYMQLSSSAPCCVLWCLGCFLPRCVVCGLQPGAPSTSICAQCESDFFAAETARCERCAIRMRNVKHGRSAHLRALPGRDAALRYNDDTGRLCFARRRNGDGAEVHRPTGPRAILWATAGESIISNVAFRERWCCHPGAACVRAHASARIQSIAPHSARFCVGRRPPSRRRPIAARPAYRASTNSRVERAAAQHSRRVCRRRKRSADNPFSSSMT